MCEQVMLWWQPALETLRSGVTLLRLPASSLSSYACGIAAKYHAQATWQHADRSLLVQNASQAHAPRYCSRSRLGTLPCRVHDVARGTGTDVYRCLSMFLSLRLSLYFCPNFRKPRYMFCLGAYAPMLNCRGEHMLLVNRTGACCVPSGFECDLGRLKELPGRHHMQHSCTV